MFGLSHDELMPACAFNCLHVVLCRSRLAQSLPGIDCGLWSQREFAFAAPLNVLPQFCFVRREHHDMLSCAGNPHVPLLGVCRGAIAAVARGNIGRMPRLPSARVVPVVRVAAFARQAVQRGEKVVAALEQTPAPDLTGTFRG